MVVPYITFCLHLPLEFFLIRDFRIIWQLPNCKIVISVDVCGNVMQNFEMQPLNHFKQNWLNHKVTILRNFSLVSFQISLKFSDSEKLECGYVTFI